MQVCPTGIDIRNGLQNECIGCAACIDVCNGVMDRWATPRGLIRYSTENGVRHGWTRLQMFRRALRPRVLIYGAVLSAASVAFAASVALRSPFQFDVIKDRGALARIVDEGTVENVYRLQIMNRTEVPQTYQVAASGIPGLALAAPQVTIAPAGIESLVVGLQRPPRRHRRCAAARRRWVFELTMLPLRRRLRRGCSTRSPPSSCRDEPGKAGGRPGPGVEHVLERFSTRPTAATCRSTALAVRRRTPAATAPSSPPVRVQPDEPAASPARRSSQRHVQQRQRHIEHRVIGHGHPQHGGKDDRRVAEHHREHEAQRSACSAAS